MLRMIAKLLEVLNSETESGKYQEIHEYLWHQ